MLASVRVAPAETLDVMPLPAEAVVSPGVLRAYPDLVITTARPAGARLKGGMDRARTRWAARFGGEGAGGGTVKLLIDCAGAAPDLPREAEDESYSLDVGAGGCVLRAATDIGALRGLSTLVQLVGGGAAGGWSLPLVSIHDRPRFAWRGLMIDVARHWQPMPVIERNLDAMEVVKLNVLHLHLTDDQGFRIESRTHPELQGEGSDGHFFTQADIRHIVAYAAARGIRVVPEFDVPGHATSWVVSHPELASMPGPYSIERQWGVFNPVLDPTNEGTYALLGDFLGEMADLFPDRFIHIGGDENNGVQWNANPRIQAFIREHGLKGNEGLHAYFNTRIEAILAKKGKRVVGWDEILNTALPKSCVIDSWRGPDGVAAATALGFDTILSNGYYIDLCYPASEHYLADPIPPGSALTAAQKGHVMGGEATMWAEWVTPETIDSRIWPRTAAIAERLWSPDSVRNVADMYRRLDSVSQRLSEAGALHLRNRDAMLRHLVGANLAAPGVGELRGLISLVEPVKWYRRGGLQLWGNQLMPLIVLADAASPESEEARLASSAIDAVATGPAASAAASAGGLRPMLRHWSDIAAAIPPLAARCPAVREAQGPAKALAAASQAAGEAIDSLEGRSPMSWERMQASLAALDDAAKPDVSAVELPVLPAVRRLVVAAGLSGQRAGMGPDAWRTLVETTAAPKGDGKPR